MFGDGAKGSACSKGLIFASIIIRARVILKVRWAFSSFLTL
jgi:hypothetical protein